MASSFAGEDGRAMSAPSPDAVEINLARVDSTLSNGRHFHSSLAVGDKILLEEAAGFAAPRRNRGLSVSDRIGKKMAEGVVLGLDWMEEEYRHGSLAGRSRASSGVELPGHWLRVSKDRLQEHRITEEI
jgi:hypothetical protein